MVLGAREHSLCYTLNYTLAVQELCSCKWRKEKGKRKKGNPLKMKDFCNAQISRFLRPQDFFFVKLKNSALREVKYLLLSAKLLGKIQI